MSRRARPGSFVVLVLSLLAVLSALLVATERLGVVVTNGVSMNPTYYEGDLVIVAADDAYRAGQSVAYHDAVHDLTVLHRIIDGDATGWVLQGDNNESVDGVRPTDAEVIGRAVLHVPQGGTWLRRLTSPPALAGLAFLLLAGGTATTTRRSRRRNWTMSRHAARPTFAPPKLEAVPPALQTAGTVAAGAALLGVLAGVFAWTAPTTEQTTVQERSERSMSFGYSASVVPSAAYDGTTVTSPDPVFRRLADQVDVAYRYEGEPSAVAITAELSTASGWNVTVPLTAAETRPGEGVVRLDLPALEARAKAAAAATGLLAERVSVRVVATVSAPGTPAFLPALALELTPLQLVLPGGASALTVPEAATTSVVEAVPASLGLLGRELPVSTVRGLSALLVAAGVVVGAAVLALARRTPPQSEAAGIHQRYGSLLVEVQPMTSTAGRPVVDVTAFATLARLAERYGLLVLHWSRSGVETFLVQDDSTTFRYRSGSSAAGPLPGFEEDAEQHLAAPELTGKPATTVLPYSRS